MQNEHEVIQQTIYRALSGKDAHVENANILAGLDWNLAGVQPEGVPHSLFELANHMIYWQEWTVKWLDGKKPRAPKHAAGGWPGKPKPVDQKEWEKTVKRYDALRDAAHHRVAHQLSCRTGGVPEASPGCMAASLGRSYLVRIVDIIGEYNGRRDYLPLQNPLEAR
jgi:hypothetical protein